MRLWAGSGRRKWGGLDEEVAILRGKEERVAREEFLEETLFELRPSRMRSLFLAECTACASGSRVLAVSYFVLGPEDTVVPHSSPPTGDAGRQMLVGQIIPPMNVTAKCDACRGGELGAVALKLEALHVWEPGKL